MARKKQPVVPLFTMRIDFAETLEAMSMQAIMLIQQCETIVGDDKLIPNEGVRKLLADRTAAFKATLTRDE